jgi:signal transduction histidine kinase
MKKIRFISWLVGGMILICSRMSVLSAQTPKEEIDSLLHILDTQKLSEKEQLRIYDKIITVSATFWDMDFAFDYVPKAMALAQKRKDILMQAKLMNVLGAAYYYRAEFDSATVYYNQVLTLASGFEDKTLWAKAHYNLAMIAHSEEKILSAIDHLMKALPVFEKKRDTRIIAKINESLGHYYYNIINFDQSLRYYSKAESLLQSENQPLISAYICSSLSELYLACDSSLELVVGYCQRAIDLFLSVPDEENVVTSYITMASAYTEHGFYDLALEYLDKVSQYPFTSKIVDSNNQGRMFYGRAEVAFKQGRYEECITYLLQSMAVSRLKRWDTDYYDMLCEANIQLGRSKEAAELFHKYKDSVKEVSTKEFQSSLSEMEVIYETEKKEIRIAALESERRLYIWLAVAGVAVLLLSLLTLLFWFRRMKKERQLIATQSLLDGETAERTRLSRDLHDGLGGMLSVVKLNLDDMQNTVIMSGEDVEHFNHALATLEDSIRELRRVAHNLMPDSLVRYGLKASLTDFCSSVPHTEFSFYGDADQRLDPKLEAMIYRTVHELVNNVIKHAAAKHTTLQIIQEARRLSLTIHDDGCGFDVNRETKGIGLTNIRNRVLSYNGHIEIHSQPGKGTEISAEFKI